MTKYFGGFTMTWNDRITSRIISLFLTALFVLSSATGITCGQVKADPTLEAPVWPIWVHRHWVWENDGTQDTIKEMVNGYIERGIPVGAIIIDRPWSADVGTFEPDPALYPDLAEHIKQYHDRDIRVMMWTIPVVNESSPNFEEGKANGYFLSNGKTVKWWAGKGAFIDYTSPEAVAWWHKQLDVVLDMGIDGWKVDMADVHKLKLFPSTGQADLHVSWKEYREMSYDDFFYYTREKLGSDRVISARPIDDLALRIGLPFIFADRENNFAGWVGDQDNDWGGLRHALNNMLASSRYNYVSYGSDIGGFRSDGNQYKDVFIRWAQLGAFCPVMENGGGGEHRPWMFDEETLAVYKKFAVLHHELIPYIYSQAAYSYEVRQPTMRPQTGTYQYMLGDELLVAPMFEQGNTRTVVFPKGDWIYLFDESKTYSSGTKKLDFALDEYPVFVRKGAIIPMEVTCGTTGFGSELSADYTTVLLYPDKGSNQFGLYEENKAGSMISYTKDSKTLTIQSTPSERALLFRVYGEPEPVSVRADGVGLTQAASMEQLTSMPAGYYTADGITWIGVKNNLAGADIQVTYD